MPPTVTAASPTLGNILEFGTMTAVVGPPGFGKSTFALSAAKMGLKMAVACSPGGEKLTYEGHGGVTPYVFEDLEWQPALGLKNAGAFTQACKTLWDLRGSDYKVVGVDTFNAFQLLAEHECNVQFSVDDPSKLGDGNRFAYWGVLAEKGRTLLGVLKALRQSGKHIIVAIHQDIKDMEGNGGKQIVNKQGVRELAWNEGKVPAVRGSLRETLAGDFDIFGFMERDVMGDNLNYFIRVKANDTAWAKVRAPIFGSAARIPADFKYIVEATGKYLEGLKGGGGK